MNHVTETRSSRSTRRISSVGPEFAAQSNVNATSRRPVVPRSISTAPLGATIGVRTAVAAAAAVHTLVGVEVAGEVVEVAVALGEDVADGLPTAVFSGAALAAVDGLAPFAAAEGLALPVAFGATPEGVHAASAPTSARQESARMRRAGRVFDIVEV